MVETGQNLRDFADEAFETGTLTEIAVLEAADGIVATLKVPVGMTQILFEVLNAGANPFDQFEIQRRPHDDAAWETVAATAGDYASPKSPIVETNSTSDVPVTLAAGETTQILMNVDSTRAIRILASANGGVTTAELFYRFGE